MKHLWKVLIAMAVTLALVVVPATVNAITPSSIVPEAGYNSVLLLENKDTAWNAIPSDEIYGILSYNSSGTTFNFSLKAYGLENTDYSLIYYADKPDRFSPTEWGGDNPGALIGTGTAVSGSLTITGNPDLGQDLPSPPDANMCEYNYCLPKVEGGTGDFYETCQGAKIWLVPSSCYDVELRKVTSWQPTRFLFETDLIWYNDTDVQDATACMWAYVLRPQLCVSVAPNALDFGALYPNQCSGEKTLTLYNCGSVDIAVTTLVSGNLYTQGLQIKKGEVYVPANSWTTTIAAGEAEIIKVKLCVPAVFPDGMATGSLSFIAAAQTP